MRLKPPRKRYLLPIKLEKLDPNYLNQDFNIYMTDSSKIDHTTRIITNAVFGQHTIVEKNCIIEKSVIGKNCKIMSSCKISNSIIWDDVVIEQECVIQNAIISNKCHIKARATISSGSILS